jgi:hypothetical protein
VAQRLKVRRLGAVALAVAFIATAAASAAPTTKWKTYVANNASFSVAVPSSWVNFTRASGEALKAVKVDPKLKPYLDYVKKNRSIKLLLIDPGLRRNFAANLNVVQVRYLGNLEQLRDASVAQLKSLGVLRGPIRTSFVRLPAGRALELVYHAEFAPNPEVAQVQFVLLKGGIENVLTYTALPRDARHYRPIFERSARTFRFR